LTLPLLTANADPPTGHLSGETRDRDLDMYAEEQSSRGEGSEGLKKPAPTRKNMGQQETLSSHNQPVPGC
jgi:hypothetical protein